MKTQSRSGPQSIPDFNPARAGRKWLAYFDLLAWSRFCENADLQTIYGVYKAVLEKLESKAKGWPKLARAWASDTFMFYTSDDSPDAFQTIDHVSRSFQALMLKEEIPMRGALVCDDLYADEDSRIFFGRALVEAHKYAEGQDWIGLVLAPSAERRATELGLLPSAFYRAWPVCFKKEAVENLQAFVLDSIHLSPAGGDALRKLAQMSNRVQQADVKIKYTRTIKFIKRDAAEHAQP
jgi:hypothetical protein